MKTKHRFFAAMVVMGVVLIVFGQDFQRPTIKSIKVINSEPPLAKATCKTSSAGYLMMPDGRTTLTAQEVGAGILENLKEGLTLTVSPPSKSGIFIDAECPNR
jgi:hypothetical protein